MRDLTMADVEDYYLLDVKWSRFEALRATTRKAAYILETEGEGNPVPPRTREGAEAGGSKRSPPPAPRKLRVINNPPPLPEAFQAAIRRVAGGRVAPVPAKLVIQKRLFPSDLNSDSNRFSIPFNQILSRDFLTAEEERHLDSYDETGKNRKKIEVRIVGPSPEMETVVNLVRWNMRNSANYVINGNWRDVVAKSGLKEEMEVQLWSFRSVERDLCFALLILPGN